VVEYLWISKANAHQNEHERELSTAPKVYCFMLVKSRSISHSPFLSKIASQNRRWTAFLST